MYHVLSLANVRIPSVNHKYIKTKTGRFILCRQYREAKELLTSKCQKITILPPYRVTIILETYSDIDNGLKIILDSLKENCIEDDSLIKELVVHKHKIKRGKGGQLDVYVETIPQPLKD